MAELLPLNILSFAPPCEAMFADTAIAPWNDDGTKLSVVFVGFASAFMFDEYLSSRQPPQIQIFAHNGEPLSRILDFTRAESSISPEPWIELLLEIPLSQCVEHEQSGLFVTVDNANECESLRSLIQPWPPQRPPTLAELGIDSLDDLSDSPSEAGASELEKIRATLKEKGIILGRFAEPDAD